ncbi:MAG: SDR family NAD(P)-dependent oxidoreductase [Acidimicrobiales bacterium]|nr:SDR family NAD(P)-dependent oxidoreductase [Acidimicrobiales bacterium]
MRFVVHHPNRSAVVVTGTSSGIGEATARHLAGLGYRVHGTVRHLEDADGLVAELGDRYVPVVLDVTDADAVAAGRRQVLADLDAAGHRLAGVFSNAGIARMDGDLTAEGCPIDVQEQVMAVNHFGAVRILQAFLPRLRADHGRVVVNSALMTRTVIPFNAGYAEAKSALEAYAVTLRRELRPHGVPVTILRAAAIDSALEAKQDATAVPAGGPYPAQRPFMAAFLSMQARRAGSDATSPDRMAEAVERALSARRPPLHLTVGGGSRPIWLLGALPERVQDAVLGIGVATLARRGRAAR